MPDCLFVRSARRLLFVIALYFLAGNIVQAQFGVISREEALASAFPGAAVTSERIFLTDAQVDQIEELSRADVDSKLYARYIARQNGVLIGRAYVDTHQVRTKKESLVVSLNADGSVRRIDTVVFLEPPEYVAGPSWMAQFYDKFLDRDIAIQRAIRPIAGGTITANTVTLAVRRVMALDLVLRGETGGAGP